MLISIPEPEPRSGPASSSNKLAGGAMPRAFRAQQAGAGSLSSPPYPRSPLWPLFPLSQSSHRVCVPLSQVTLLTFLRHHVPFLAIVTYDLIHLRPFVDTGTWARALIASLHLVVGLGGPESGTPTLAGLTDLFFLCWKSGNEPQLLCTAGATPRASPRLGCAPELLCAWELKPCYPMPWPRVLTHPSALPRVTLVSGASMFWEASTFTNVAGLFGTSPRPLTGTCGLFRFLFFFSRLLHHHQHRPLFSGHLGN